MCPEDYEDMEKRVLTQEKQERIQQIKDKGWKVVLIEYPDFQKTLTGKNHHLRRRDFIVEQTIPHAPFAERVTRQ